MATQFNLATGLGGAIGSDYVQSQNRVYFVEYNGKISVIDLVRPLDVVVFSGVAVMPADSSLNLMNGTSAQGGQIRWDHTSPGAKRVMRSQGNCDLAYVGAANYDDVTQAELQNLDFSADPDLRGQAPNNQLTAGMIFGVYNKSPQASSNFDIAKVQVLQNYGGSIKIRWVSYRLKPRMHVLGLGYTNPEDIKVTSGGRYAYVTERSGHLMRVDLTNANHASAQMVASGMTAPHQIALDEEHGQAYICEYTETPVGKIWRVDLSSGIKTALFAGLNRCTGLLMSKDLAFAYVSEQAGGAGGTGCLARINLASGQHQILASGLTAPFFMEWGDAVESCILLPEREPANRIKMVDLTTSPVTVSTPLNAAAFSPSSLVIIRPGIIVVCSSTEVNQYDLTGSAFLPAGPLFMGVGLVPIDHIINTGSNATDGYADTTDNPAYPIHVKDSPFGGTLEIRVNHNAALLAGAVYYKLFVEQVTPAAVAPWEPRQSFSDYLWNATSSSFVPTTTSPDAGGFYPVRLPIHIWYNPLLGYRLDTGILANGLAIIDIKLYDAAKVEIPVASFHSRRVKIDNQWPEAKIEKILHQGTEVQVCQLVDTGLNEFTFRITASDPQGHLLSWSLSAMWGDNASTTVAGDSYSAHVSPTRQWTGVVSGPPDVPAPPWHAINTHCAHTFYLGVWDRVINGNSYLHYRSYHKSITIWLP